MFCGHDRAGEAAVADRVEHLVVRLLALVEVRPVRALAVADRWSPSPAVPAAVEGVAARAALLRRARRRGGPRGLVAFGRSTALLSRRPAAAEGDARAAVRSEQECAAAGHAAADHTDRWGGPMPPLAPCLAALVVAAGGGRPRRRAAAPSTTLRRTRRAALDVHRSTSSGDRPATRGPRHAGDGPHRAIAARQATATARCHPARRSAAATLTRPGGHADA